MWRPDVPAEAIEAGLAALVEGLRRRHPGAEITVLENNQPQGSRPEADLKLEGQRAYTTPFAP